METYNNAHHPHTHTRHLTQLYSDTKKSALISLEGPPAEFSSLHRKYRIQKDRLITWGLAWSDDERGPDGNIDESVAQAGLTETVDSVLRNIKEVTEEAERIKAAASQGILSKAGDSKLPLSAPFDDARYEDLLRDLTASIDTLYDLSRSRKALARGEHPTFNSVQEEKLPPSNLSKAASIRSKLSGSPSYASSEITLVNPPPFTRPSLSPYAGLPPRIDLSALRLPEEGPPPYEAVGVPSTTRLVGHLVRAKASESVQNAVGSSAAEVPILVEYANFDQTYRDTGVPPPLQRLESLTSFFQPMRPESQMNLSLLGYFEDAHEPRIGLVYDLPYSIQNRLQGNVETEPQQLSPISLLKLVQKANKAQSSGKDAILPSLEDRFRIAMRLTQQLQALHARGVPHGNINSSSVIFATMERDSQQSRQKQLRSPLWASFDLFSKCSVEGRRRPVNLNIYRHPHDDPQAHDRTFEADIKFDLYGLALLLLEIGLWTPVGDLYKAKYTLADFKLRLDKLWIPKLAAKCGSSYMRAVIACLHAADETSTITEDLYHLVLRNLHRCCMIDEYAPVDPLAPTDNAAELPAPTPSEKVKRKPVPEQTSLMRQQSDPPELTRTSSWSTGAFSPKSRLSSVPSLPAIGPGSIDWATIGDAAVARKPPPRTSTSVQERPVQDSRAQPKRRLSNRMRTRPSFKDYKSKIVLIQKKWREYRAGQQQLRYEEAQAREVTIAESEIPPVQTVRQKRTEFPSLQLPQAVIDDWHNNTSLRLAKLVEKALKGSKESSSIALTAFGETIDDARPTYLVCCTSTSKVKSVLKRHFLFDSETCDVRVRRDEIRRCRRPRRISRSALAHRSMALSDGDESEKAVNPDYQERPICGASIGAFREEEHLPPVSFGGVILVDGTAYGMSVHHMLESEDTEDEDSLPVESDYGSDTSSIRSFDNLSTSSESEDESTVRQPSTIDETSHPSDSHDGDCPGILPGDFEEIVVTQPALDDAIEMDLHVDEEEDSDEDSGIDEDHLLSYKLGQVHASSGLRRSSTSLEGGFRSISQSLPQEIDWALFELLPPRAHPYNVVRGGARYCRSSGRPLSSRDSYPSSIRPSSDLACAKVHCLGRTSGLASGMVSSTMELVKIHGRSTFSASWTVDGEFGVGGDSGAWVIGNDDGKVCGHVLAFRRGKTYICPMDLLLDDIKATLRASRVALPTPVNVRSRQEGRLGAEEEREVREAVHRMKLGGPQESGGGVALPSNKGGFGRRAEALEAAG